MNPQAVAQFLHSIKTTIRLLFKVDITGDVFIIDHSQALYKGVKRVFPKAVRGTTCNYVISYVTSYVVYVSGMC